MAVNSQLTICKGMPPNFDATMSAINSSRAMLEWEANWDGEGSPLYAEDTWSRATTFLVQSAKDMWRDYSISIAAPMIEPGPDGSIDIHWLLDDRELSLNVPADAEKPSLSMVITAQASQSRVCSILPPITCGS